MDRCPHLFCHAIIDKNEFYTFDNSSSKNIRNQEQKVNVEKLNKLHDLGAWISIHKTSLIILQSFKIKGALMEENQP
jgi:hypothetical protein